MILLTAVLLGVLTGWGLARWQKRIWHPPEFMLPGLIVVGFLPQWLAFYFGLTRNLLSDEAASVCLVFSQVLLLGAAILNIRLPGLPLLIIGLALNLIVIIANGGFMPLSAEAVSPLLPPERLERIGYGERVGPSSKDVLLREADIQFPWLADRFVSPKFVPYRFIFSMGDVWIALGAYLMLAVGRRAEINHEHQNLT